MLGVTVAGEEDSNFTKVHDNGYIRAAKRLYMTATPKIFSASNIRKAKENNALLWSMDDKNIYGPEFFRLSFSHAVKLGLLSDYKVMILAIYDNYVSNLFDLKTGLFRELVYNLRGHDNKQSFRQTGCQLLRLL